MSDVLARMTDTLRWLCEIESFTGEEGALCDAMVERLASAPLAQPLRRYENSLVAAVSRGTGGPHVAFAGHLDVVRTSHDGPVRIEGDRFYGPGSSDMKSGLAVMLDLLEHEPALFERVDVTMIFYSREEGPYLENELRLVLDGEPELSAVDLAVCLEPSDNRLSLGASGSIHAGVQFRGRTSHSARPWQGHNAIHAAGALLSDLAALEPQEVTIDGLLYRTVTSATLASGGRGRNVIPDSFELNLNHRFSPDKSLEQAQAEVEALVAGRAEITWRDLSPAAPPHADHPLVRALQDSGVTEVEPKQAWTDVAQFAQRGTAAVNFGPGVNSQAHQRNEWTSLAQLDQGRTIIADWLERIGERS